MKARSIGLLGLGRFGQMVYEHLKPHGGLRVWTRDARKLEGTPEAGTFEEVARCEIVVLTVAISAMQETCRRLAPLMRPGQTVVDTCSVKVRPVEIMLAELPDSVAVLGTHPLFGPDSGKDGIAGLKIVLCPVRIDAADYAAIGEHLASLGLQVIEATPEEHDRQAARNQALFHVLAQTLKQLGWGGEPMATPGPETLHRLLGALQNDSYQLFLDMQRENPFAAEYRQKFLSALRAVDQELSTPIS
jgi:prephenate dehydrogenase